MTDPAKATETSTDCLHCELKVFLFPRVARGELAAGRTIVDLVTVAADLIACEVRRDTRSGWIKSMSDLLAERIANEVERRMRTLPEYRAAVLNLSLPEQGGEA